MLFGGWHGAGFGSGWSHGWSGTLSEEDVTLLLLSLLEAGPLYGYELALALEERSDGGLDADPELVYPLLQLLVDRELVAVRAVDGKNRYELTDAGLETVGAREARIRRLWRRARLHEEELIEEAVECACLSVGAALREVSGALGEAFGCASPGRSHGGRTGRARSHGSGCCG